MAAAMAFPAMAFADTTVNFDDLAAGTTVTNQYADLGGAGQGVTFGPLPGSGGSGWNPVVRTPPAGQAQSGTNVADIDTAPGVEFPSPVTTGTFAVPRSQVSVDVGWLDDPAPCSNPSTDNGCAVVTLTGYDASGNVVATSAPGTVTAGGGIHTALSISTSSATIVGFKIAGRDSDDEFKQLAIDDLSFNTPTTPPPPDFTLTPAQTTVNVTDGASATDTIAVGRLAGSSGDVDLAVSGALPAGVHATISPAQASGTTSTLTLTADPNAAVSPTAGTVTVTGTPSGAAVGTAPRSFNLTIGVQAAFSIFAGGPPSVSINSCTASVPLFLTRSLAFNGPVSLSVAGLPPGVQASFSSNPVTFPAGEGQTTVELDLTAAHNGEVQFNRTVTVTASDPPLADQTTTFTAGGTCPLQYDAQVTSIQITQGVQSPFLPAQNYTTHPASVVPYSEIPNAAELRAGGATIVRVYADLAFGPSGGVPNIPAELIGYTHNEIGSVVPLPGSPLLPTSPPRTLQVGPATATDAEEGSETGAYTFTLPPSWTHGTITVAGVVLPAQAPPVVAAANATRGPNAVSPGGPVVAPCDTTPCNQNDALTLSAIPFYDAPTVTINPVQLQVNGAALPDPSQVFQWARLVTPLNMQVEPYQGTIDITDLANTFNACTGSSCSDNANDAASSRFDDWVCDNGAPQFGWDMGINTGVARGLTNHDDICWSQFNGYQDSVVEYKRPLTSVAHEFFHLLGRPHASDCGGGGSNGQTAESWPPDQMGYTQSVGLDTTLGSGLHGGPYAIASPPGATWYDFMSYCASGANTSSPLTLANAPAWGSTHNWNAVMESFRYHGVRQPLVHASVASAPRPSLLVNAYLQHGGPATIDSVTPLKTVTRTVANSGFELVGLDAAGHQVATAHMAVEPLHVDGEAPPLGLEGAIPSARVTSVEVVSSGAVVATRHQSAHAPTITLRGVPVARRGITTIRWHAQDADHNRLLAEIDYSRNDGRSYRRLWIGPSRGVARLPSRYLSRSARARIAVTVNDGFRTATVHSRRFRAPGAGPVVTILSPHRGAREPNDAALVLTGQAFDDAGRSLTGGRLRWFEGSRLLGSGAQIAPAGLKPGRNQIVLVARDGAGRLGRASVTVSLSATRPLFLILSAPRQVKRTARVLKLKVSSSLEAKLSVRTGTNAKAKAQQFDVSRRLRTLSVKIAKGTKPLTLRLSLAAGGLTRTETVSVARS